MSQQPSYPPHLLPRLPYSGLLYIDTTSSLDYENPLWLSTQRTLTVPPRAHDAARQEKYGDPVAQQPNQCDRYIIWSTYSTYIHRYSTPHRCTIREG